MTQREQVNALVDLARRTYGRLDVMINNAGIMPLSLLEQLKVDEWERMIDVNIKGVLYGIAAALPVMRDRNRGSSSTSLRLLATMSCRRALSTRGRSTRCARSRTGRARRSCRHSSDAHLPRPDAIRARRDHHGCGTQAIDRGLAIACDRGGRDRASDSLPHRAAR